LFGDACIGFIFKLFLVMFLLMVLLGGIVVSVVYWPFTLGLFIGLLFTEWFYKRLNKLLRLRLPRYFYISIFDLVGVFHEGEGELVALRNELDTKRNKASRQVLEIRQALNSIDEQLSQVKTNKVLGKLFKKDTVDVSPRAAKALEMELGKPRWSAYIDKLGKNGNGSWGKYLA